LKDIRESFPAYAAIHGHGLQKWGQKAPSFMAGMTGPSGLTNICSHGYSPSICRG